MAYNYTIQPNTVDSHQMSPGYLLTFVRWDNRDTANYQGDSMKMRNKLLVISDAISINISESKSSYTPSLTAVLKMSDINYATAIAPGDFVTCNIVTFDNKIMEQGGVPGPIYSAVENSQPVNKFEYGFKGVFKVQTVRKILTVDPATGTKVYAFAVQAYGFTEFNNHIYYDPILASTLQSMPDGGLLLFMEQFGKYWADKAGAVLNIQEIMRTLVSVLLGGGVAQTTSLTQTNTLFRIPAGVGSLLGNPSANYVSDVYNFIFGIWDESSSGALNAKSGFNPGITNNGKNFYTTSRILDGSVLLAPDWWNNVRIWDILMSYLNDTINEMYVSYRVAPTGLVMPTVTFRQKPFNNRHFKGAGTKFLDLPRWKLDPKMVTGFDLGRDEASRINMVQIYTKTLAMNDPINKAIQATSNLTADSEDIQRSGLRPYIRTAPFDFASTDTTTITQKGAQWSKLVSDWLFGGHLKESGTINCVGIEEPIAVGDNLFFDGIVYHIEGITHQFTVQANGLRQFRTTLTVSFGVSDESDSTRPVYANMEHTSADKERESDFINNKLLPGVSESQDAPGRVAGEAKTSQKDEGTFTKSATLNPIQTRSAVRADSVPSETTDTKKSE